MGSAGSCTQAHDHGLFEPRKEWSYACITASTLFGLGPSDLEQGQGIFPK